MPGEHSRISPSRLPSLDLCPGQLHAEEEIRAQPGWIETSSKAADDGTRRHALAEWRQLNPAASWPVAGSVCCSEQRILSRPAEIDGLKISTADVDAVELVMDYVLKHPALSDQVCGKRWLEQKMEIGQWVDLPKGLVSGTADVIFATRDTLEVLDFKFGRRIISPDNLQNRAYAIGAGALLDWGGMHRGVKNLRLTIAQPANPAGAIQSADFGIDVLMDEWAPELKRVAEAALDSVALRTPGEKQCRFCLANGSCRERLNFQAQGLFDPIPTAVPGIAVPLAAVATVDTIASVVDAKLTQDPTRLSNEELGTLLDQAGLLEGFIKNGRAEMAARLKRGAGEGSGWKLVAGRKKRGWTADAPEVEKTLRGCGLKIADIYPREIPSVPKAEAMVKVKGTRAIARMQALVKVEAGAPVLAPEGDSRPSVVEDLFQPVDEVSTPSAPSELPEWLQ